ncbi:MAG: hypothetical protein D6689_11075 [Deltaproteobacteria bacterium]|nr:MAG: hypothetical protein D6689_11075 [Deltaproteobacteria bacterium]
MTKTASITASLLAMTLGACAGEITGSTDRSPSDPTAFDDTMFDRTALAHLDLEDRAYVQGHALGVYLYGKTLPGYIGHRYIYEPGFSAPRAAVPYDWNAVMVVRSGGTDGNGTMAFSGDTECPPDDDTENPPGDDTENPPGDDTENPPDTGTIGSGDDVGGGDDGDDGCPDDDEPVDPDCEAFLDPAALDARDLAAEVDAVRVLGPDFPADERYARAFRRGLAEALYLEDLDEATDHSEVEAIKKDVQSDGLCEHSPLVLDLAGDGLELAPAGNGVVFDLRGIGVPVRTAWPTGADDALLALDWNANGTIDDGSELFGNGRGHADGFDALARIDAPGQGGNGDGIVDTRDARFADLLLWRDANGDGVSQPNELTRAVAEGVVSIDLDHGELGARDPASGSRLMQAGGFVRVDAEGSAAAGTIIDVWFKYRAAR